MEVRIVEERTNPLLKRHEVRFEVAHATAATPTRESVRSELAKTVNASKDRVVIERMRPRYGTAVTRGEANVYDTADAAKSITRSHILVRNGLKEKEPKGAAPAASPTAPAGADAAAKPEPAAPVSPPEPPTATEAKPAEPKPAEAKHHAAKKSDAEPAAAAAASTEPPASESHKKKAHPKKE